MRRRPERKQGPGPGRTVRPLTFTFTLWEVEACGVLSKGMSGLVCFNRLSVPAELRVVQIGSRNENRDASQEKMALIQAKADGN